MAARWQRPDAELRATFGRHRARPTAWDRQPRRAMDATQLIVPWTVSPPRARRGDRAARERRCGRRDRIPFDRGEGLRRADLSAWREGARRLRAARRRDRLVREPHAPRRPDPVPRRPTRWRSTSAVSATWSSRLQTGIGPRIRTHRLVEVATVQGWSGVHVPSASPARWRSLSASAPSRSRLHPAEPGDPRDLAGARSATGAGSRRGGSRRTAPHPSSLRARSGTHPTRP